MTPIERVHVVCRVGPGDTYSPGTLSGDSVVYLALEAPGASATESVTTGVWPALHEHGFVPLGRAVDLYRAAATVYAADARVLRANAFDLWTRNLVLHLPVSDVAAWQRAGDEFVELLTFLTGDRWAVHFRPGAPGAPAPHARRRSITAATPPTADAVCLLSGGLDSFVGALDQLSRGRRLLMVSHNAVGSARFSSPAQDDIQPALKAVAGSQPLHLKMNVNPPKKTGAAKAESTQRSRSIIFLGLGVLAASSLHAGTPLVVPENGFISLNAPLTNGRLGSLSTRTTHPHVLAQVRKVLMTLDLDVPIEAPYRFKTKGEMLRDCAAGAILRAYVQKTCSCARPYDHNADAGRPQAHCGYCVPCIIRRASMRAAGMDDISHYRYDVHSERNLIMGSPARMKDLRGFEMALARAARGSSLTDVLRAGQLDCAPDEVQQYLRVYRAGLDEVGQFLNNTPMGANL